jgi:DNA-binding transcriptional MocR family regulator
MTMWRPELRDSKRPVYLAIVEALAADVGSGRLAAGDRLPPQRDLAEDLGVTMTTVTRAYAEAARRGLLEGEVGRGTFVRRALAESSDAVIDLTRNAVPPHAHAFELASRLAPSAADRVRALEYQPPGGLAEHAEAGKRWLEGRGWDPSAHEVLVTAGAQHALAVALMTLLPGGGDLLVEEVTYAGVRELAAALRITLHAVDLDANGLSPADLDAVCRRTHARVLYTMPALQNPTGLSMTLERRHAIAAVAGRRNLTIVEDDTYGFVTSEPPLAALAPDRTLVVTSLSKSVAGGLRVGFLAAPPRYRDGLSSNIWTTVVMASPITASIAADLINDGTAGRVASWKREELRARQILARSVLERVPDATHPASPHVWLTLERPWKSEAFTSEARARGVLVTPSSAFAAREGASPRAVRVVLGVPRTRERLSLALTRLAELHREGPGRTAVM